MCIVHDLGEAIGGDVPAPEQARRRAADPGATKATQEREDLLHVCSRRSPRRCARTITALWDEYESAASPEARVAKALDKLETILQHTQGANPHDFDYRFNLGYGRAFTDNHPAIVRLRALLDRETERLAELNAPPQPGKPVLALLRSGRRRGEGWGRQRSTGWQSTSSCGSTARGAAGAGSADDAARRAARAARPHRHEEGLRPRPVRRLHGARRRPARQLLPDARGDAAGHGDHDDRRARATATSCTRCSRRSSRTTASSAATARPGRSCRRSRCSASRAGRRDDDVRECMSGNICRCGAYPNIVAAVQDGRAAARRRDACEPFIVRAAAERDERARSRRDDRGRALHRRRHDARRPDEARRRAADARWSTSTRCRSPTIDDAAGRRRARRRAGAQQRHGAPRRGPRALSGAVAGAARRRLAAAAQHGDDRRQPAAAHALPVLPRHGAAVQQARARQRLLGASTATTACTPSSARASTASRRIRRTCRVALVALDAVVARRGPDGRARDSDRASFHVLPGDHPEIETVLAARRADHRGRAARARRSRRARTTSRCATARRTRSRSRRRPSRSTCDGGTIRDARVALGGVGTKPWRAREAGGGARRPAGRASRRFARAADAALAGAVPRTRQRFQDRAREADARPRARRGRRRRRMTCSASGMRRIGKPLDRVDGAAQGHGRRAVHGRVPVEGLAHAVMVTSTIARGHDRRRSTRAPPRRRPACSR